MIFEALTTSVVVIAPTLLFASGFSPDAHGTVLREVIIQEHMPRNRYEPISSSAPAAESIVFTQGSAWQADAHAKMDAYVGLADGWRGEDSVAPSEIAIADANTLIRQIASEMPNTSMPLIGADADGIISLFWNEAGLLATISIYGDGTFSFYAESGADGEGVLTAKSDAEAIGEPLTLSLLQVMTGQRLMEAA